MRHLVSWNVNGIRSCVSKGFLQWLSKTQPDICCLQETKARVDQLGFDVKDPNGYRGYWFSAKRPGYSGVATLVKETVSVDRVESGLGIEEFDDEGRVLTLFSGPWAVINCYFPNSQREHARLPYKLAFNEALLKYSQKLRKQGLRVVICGDFNVAHREIDLKNPKSNENNAGFLPEERAWMQEFLDSGHVDSYRKFYPDQKDAYSWWSYRPGIRERNIGWRIDYFCVGKEASEHLESAAIHADVLGSDHCPVSLRVKPLP